MRNSFFGAISLFLIFSLISINRGWCNDESYKFERMWPTLKQPWYFYGPCDVAVDGAGNVYVADTGSHHIRKFSSTGDFITKWGGYGAGDGQFKYPSGIVVDSYGNIYVADTRNNRIQKFTSSGDFVAKWGGFGAGDGQFNYPQGIAVGSSGNVFVVDAENNRIQKFTSNGGFVAKWGGEGDGDGEFRGPYGITMDSGGNVFVVDTRNNRIQKFTSNGDFVAKWGSEGAGDGQFRNPFGIAVDSDGAVYVADVTNDRIQKFTSIGGFVAEWGGKGAGDGQFNSPYGLAVDSDGYIFVADTVNHRIQKFSSNRNFIAKWGSESPGDGQFDHPSGVAVDNNGSVFVVESDNHRIQKFNAAGEFVATWGGKGTGNGQFDYPSGIAVDGSGNVFVVDRGNNRIQKFSSTGDFILEWGGHGGGDGQFNSPFGVAADDTGNVFVVDSFNDRIQKFNSSSGIFIDKWGGGGSGDGQFREPHGVAVDGSGNVFVADTFNDRIQKFSSNGVFVAEWGGVGSGDGLLFLPYGVGVDSDGNVFVADSGNHRIQKFSSIGDFLTRFGEFGSEAGLVNDPWSISVNPGGKVYVADTGNNRIQVFGADDESPDISESLESKAIIVAGGGPYVGNALWDATQLCANYAYRSLLFQGYARDMIYYLSADTDLDFDGNGILDDVDGDAANSNLKYAIETWAKDAEALFIYITNHGGPETFVINYSENLDASELDAWLDKAQEAIPGPVTILYDACQAGSFISALTPPAGKSRILATSAASKQPAYFGSSGSLAFSYFFWTQMLIGQSFYDSYVNAKDSIRLTYVQNAQIEANGNGIPNEREDKEIALTIKIGNEIKTAADLPRIGEASPAQSLDGGTSAVIYADNVLDADGVSQVWAVITPPNHAVVSLNEPVLDLPIIDLAHTGNNRYEATYDGFTDEGIYKIAIFARDKSALASISLPKTTTVTKGNYNTSLSIDIQINGSDGPLTISSSESVVVSLSLDPGAHNGQNADWWIVKYKKSELIFGIPELHCFTLPDGWSSGIHRTIEYPLVAINDLEIGGHYLAPGDYTFYFSVDDNANNNPEATWFDFVDVQVVE